MIGGCNALAYSQYFTRVMPGLIVDEIQFNNVLDLPELPPADANLYDFQVIELPLRELLGDTTFRFNEFDNAEKREAVLERAKQACQVSLDAAMRYNRSHGVLTVVMNFALPQAPVVSSLNRTGTGRDLRRLISQINEYLAELLDRYPNAFLADLDSLSGSLGKMYFQDDSIYFIGHSGHWKPEDRDYDVAPWHFAPAGLPIQDGPSLAETYVSQLDDFYLGVWRQWEHIWRVARRADAVKLVIFDLDNTLWRGQIAEHYGDDVTPPVFHGWPTGMWEAIHHLRGRGILTAVCSKNDYDTVKERWDRAVHASWLTLDDFTFVEIGWGPKVEAVARIVKRAGLTAHSTVFVDDNPVERESVRLGLPGVRVIGDNMYESRRILLWSAETQVPTLTVESADREKMVKAQDARETVKQALSREYFLLTLSLEIDLFELANFQGADAVRVIELTNKTNQFNTTGQRRSLTDFQDYVRKGARVFAFSARDRFTNYGIVGVVLWKDNSLEQFVMSCRVIGLDIENAVVQALLGALGVDACHAIIAETNHNSPARDFYVRNGFTRVGDGLFQWNKRVSEPAPETHATVNVRVGEAV